MAQADTTPGTGAVVDHDVATPSAPVGPQDLGDMLVELMADYHAHRQSALAYLDLATGETPAGQNDVGGVDVDQDDSVDGPVLDAAAARVVVDTHARLAQAAATALSAIATLRAARHG